MRRPLSVIATLALALGLTSAVASPSAAADAPGGISGTVTGPDGPIDGIRVAAYHFDPAEVGGEDYPDGWIYWDDTFTSASGTYTIGDLPPADYRVQFYDMSSANGDYLEEWWDDAPTLEEADDITVAAGAVTLSRSAVLAEGGTITGAVTTQSMPNGSWFWITLYKKQPDGSFAFSDATNSINHAGTAPYGGTYSFETVAPGTYRIGVDGDEQFPDEYWNDQPTLAAADDIVVSVGQDVIGKNFHLAPPPADEPIVNNTLPSITGTPRAGLPLSVDTGTWTPAPTSFGYAWYVGASFVSGGETYTPTAADVGQTVTVQVTAMKSGFVTGHATSAATTAVMPAPAIQNTAPPCICGDAYVGKTLTTSAGSWATSVQYYTYQWLRNGVDIPGANSSAYHLGSGELGNRFSVRVTAHHNDYSPGVATSPQTSPAVLPTMQVTAAPKVVGKPRVGQKLVAQSGGWEPTNPTLTYQWLLDGVPVAGATKSFLKLKKKHLWKRVSVRVTASMAGYAPISATSLETGKVKPPKTRPARVLTGV